MPRFLYQEYTEPVVGQPITPKITTTPGAIEPWSFPTQFFAKVLSTALIASQVISFVAPSNGNADWRESITESRWHQPWSEPIVKTAARDAWYQAQVSFVQIAPFPETVTESRWHQPWSEPIVKSLPRDVWFGDFIFSGSDEAAIAQIAPVSPVDYGVFPEFRFQYQANAFVNVAPFPETVTEPRWHQPWSEPIIKSLPRTAWYQDQASLVQVPPFAETVTESRWHQPWSEPVRTPPRDAWFQPDTRSLQPVVSFSYYNWLTEPVRVAARDAWYQPDNFGRAAPFPETVTEPRWHQPWSEPVRTAPRDAWFQDLAWNPSTPVAATTDTRWFTPLSEPVRTAARDAWYQPDTLGRAAPFPEEVSEDRWHQPWSEPVRTAARAAWYEDFAWNPSTPAAAVVMVPISPVDYGVFTEFRLQYQAYAAPVNTPTVEVITVSKWFTPWQDPVRTALRDVWFQPDTFGRAAPFPEEVSEDRWHQPWSEPVRVAPRDAWYQDAVSWSTVTPAFVLPPLTWFTLFADPTRVPPPKYTFRTLLVGIPNPIPPDTGKVWPRYWIQDDPRHSINRDAPHDLVWAKEIEEDEIAILIGLL